MAKFIALLLGLIFLGTALAREAPPADPNPALEKRTLELTEQLRCLVCQNQSIAESHADLAIDLKNQVREKLKQGQSEQQIIDYMVARYGDFVLYKPPVMASTVPLWFGPFALLLVALGVLFYYIVRRRRSTPSQELSAEEQARVRSLLDGPEERS